jgi:ABC-type glycerol-3-phosphate transport system substrate-binding protein
MHTRTTQVAATLCLLLLLSACSNAAPKRTIPKPEPNSDATTIRFAFPARYGDWFAPLIQKFQDVHPEYRIETVDMSDTEPNEAQLIRDKKADLMMVNALPFQLVPSLVLDLEPYIRKSNMDLSNYKLEQSEFLFNGRLYALPMVASPRVLVGNADLFEKAGVPLPGATWTWEEFREAARKLTSADRTTWGIDPNAPELLAQLRLMQYKPGTPAWLADEAAWKDALGFWTTVVRTDMSTPPIPSDLKNGPVNRNNDPMTYINGKAAMAMGGVGMGGGLPFKQVILPIPTIPGAKPMHYVWYWSLAIPETSAEPDAAWAFMAWATGPEGGMALAKQNLLPMYLTPEIEQAWVAGQLPGAEAVMQSRWMDHFPEPAHGHMRQEMDKAIIRALSGAAPVETVAADYAAKVAMLPKKN